MCFKNLIGIEETCYGICLQCDKASHLGKKLFLPGLLYDMLYELDMPDPKKVTAELSKRGCGPSGFLPHSRNCQALCRT